MKKIAIVLAVLMVLQIIPLGCFKVYAAEQATPTNLAVATENGRPAISYSPEKGYYAKLTWAAPAVWGGDKQYYELHYRTENDTDYQIYGGNIDKSSTNIEIDNLKSGTVYYAYLTAVHEHDQPAEKHMGSSLEITFVTDTKITVEPGNNETLNIRWDNVDYKAASVSYYVYISESASFAETSPIHVSSADIGEGKAVQIQGTKLFYNAVDLKPSTIYYIKIRTVVNDDKVVILPVSASAVGFTNIKTEINKTSSDWWKLQWNAITNTNLGQNEEVLYKVIRSVDGDLEKEIAATKDTSLLVKVPSDNTYFRIKADLVSQLGSTISVVSDKIAAKESEVIAIPPVPQILDDPTQQHTQIGSDRIELLWEAPYLPTGNVDTDVVYDIWALKNSADIDNNSQNPAAANLKVGVADYVYEKIGNMTGDRVIGFKHILSKLEPNTVYYLKMIAKKTYSVNNSTSTVVSEPALKVFVTLPNGAIDQPVIPSVPPFKVKTNTVNGKKVDATTSKSITLEWKNQWYERWNQADSKWIYLADEDVAAAAVAGAVYRSVIYSPDIKFSVGYEVYSNSFDFSRLLETTAPMPMQIKDIANNTASTTIEYTVDGLQSNTAYVFWMRAYRSDSLKSHVSDPIIISTRPDYEVPMPKPAIPVINYQYKGDTYVDLSWNVINGYYYDIKYGIFDDSTKATTSIVVKPEDVAVIPKYRISGLTADTVYYFWIRARIKGANEQESISDWSDSYLIKTSPFAPPEPPKGFGIKNIADSVGKDYINFEWIYVSMLEYNLEIAKKPDFSDAVSYPSKQLAEYKVEKLLPNTRYYARLFAYDPAKKLTSQSSPVISIKTLKSTDEYDTGSDTETTAEEVPKPEFDEEDDDIAVLDVKHEKTDMLIERIASSSGKDFIINFEGLNPDESSKTKHAEGVKVSKTRISPRIFIALEQKKQNLILNNGPAALVITPEITKNKQVFDKLKNNPDCMMEITLQKISNPTNKTNSSSYVSDVWQVAIEMITDSGKTKFYTIKGLKVKLPYYDSKWFDKAAMTGAVYDPAAQQWIRIETGSNFDVLNNEGTVYFSIPGSCDFAVMKMGGGKFSDISGNYYANEIKAITEKYNIKCLGNGNFEPSKTVSKEEAVKIILDILNYNYDEDYLTPAKKAGITAKINTADMSQAAVKQEALTMVLRLCELMTGEKVQYTNTDWNSTESFSRGQMMGIIKYMLEEAGVF
ncbi:MAG: fibronectin type III domain-containing protein [Deltaproteobacteria bacterium]